MFYISVTCIYVFISMPTDEIDREREFYKSRNLPNPKDLPLNNEDEPFDQLNNSHVESDYHRQDEQVNVCLECISNNLVALQRRFIRCSSQATITHLKKFVAKKVLTGTDKYKEVSGTPIKQLSVYWLYLYAKLCLFLSFQLDILCNDEILGKDHTLKFVYVTRWRFRDPPLRLQFRPHVEL